MSRRMRDRMVALALTVAVFACSEFKSSAPLEPALADVSWPAELHLTDVDTLELEVRLDASTVVEGLRVRWESSDAAVLQVTALHPPAGASRQDTLTAQRRGVVRAVGTGEARVTATIDHSAAFRDVSLERTIDVVQKWTLVSAGDAHTCGVTVDSVAYCWGNGPSGALGNGTSGESSLPVRVVSVGQLRPTSIAASDSGACVVGGGQVGFCWGSGAKGRLGNGDASESGHLIPVEVSGGNALSTVVGGSGVGCGVAPDAIVLCWGDNSNLQLGVVPPPLLPLDVCSGGAPCSRRPRQVSAPVGSSPGVIFRAALVDVGGVHACAIEIVSRRALCWGNSPSGALGAGATTTSAAPAHVIGLPGLLSSFNALTTGTEHTCALQGNSAGCWGVNTSGQLGNGGNSPASTAVTVAGGRSFSAIAAGAQHTCALDLAGAAYCWGLGTSGQLGTGATSSFNVPAAVQGTLRFRAISAGVLHTCAIDMEGSMYCWGTGRAAGALNSVRLTPTRMAEPQ